MSDTELRDTFIGVELELPNGRMLQGRIIRWRAGMRVKALLTEFLLVPTQERFDTAWQAFSELTGITQDQVEALCPDISLGELLDMVNRFTYLRRDGATAAGTPTGPAPTSAPGEIAPPTPVSASST